MEQSISHRLTILGHPQRLALFRLLMRRYPDRVPATELARALGLKPNTLSTYVGALMKAGLVVQERVGTSLRYAINIEETRQTFDYLILDCCRGRPDICSPTSVLESHGDSSGTNRKHNVLFICTGNSARSIFAESALRHEAGDRFNAYSAGTKHRSELNPLALDFLAREGHDISGLRAKNISEFQHGELVFDFVFTVCDLAANEECPAWHGQPICAHWGVPDPAQGKGTEEQKNIAFQIAYGALLTRIEAFAALPLSSLDQIALQQAIDDIGRTEKETSS